MPTYLAFLRAINLGANRKFPKDDIRSAVEAAGFSGVQTHINTGNVLFSSSMRSRPKIEATLEAVFAADRGFDVPTFVFTPAEFSAIADDALELAEQHPGLARHYIYLLKDEPAPELKRRVEATSSEMGDMVVRGRAVHALLRPGYQDGSVDPLGAARLLEPATNRNANVVRAIAEKWC